MSNKRKKYSPEFKAKVALTALKNDETTADLANGSGFPDGFISGIKRT
jgi:transposase